MDDDLPRLRDDSDELLTSLAELRRLEREKRREDISTPKFHQMAEEVVQQARHVIEVARDERNVGNEIETTDVTTDEVADGELRATGRAANG